MDFFFLQWCSLKKNKWLILQPGKERQTIPESFRLCICRPAFPSLAPLRYLVFGLPSLSVAFVPLGTDSGLSGKLQSQQVWEEATSSFCAVSPAWQPSLSAEVLPTVVSSQNKSVFPQYLTCSITFLFIMKIQNYIYLTLWGLCFVCFQNCFCVKGPICPRSPWRPTKRDQTT